jgi:hypothetical protein
MADDARKEDARKDAAKKKIMASLGIDPHDFLPEYNPPTTSWSINALESFVTLASESQKHQGHDLDWLRQFVAPLVAGEKQHIITGSLMKKALDAYREVTKPPDRSTHKRPAPEQPVRDNVNVFTPSASASARKRARTGFPRTPSVSSAASLGRRSSVSIIPFITQCHHTVAGAGRNMTC